MKYLRRVLLPRIIITVDRLQVVGIESKKDSLLNEADTCRKYVIPRLIQAGWDADPHSFTEQRNFTDAG